VPCALGRDRRTNTVECSDELYRIFGLPLPSEGGAEYTSYQGVHPEDLTVVQNAAANPKTPSHADQAINPSPLSFL